MYSILCMLYPDYWRAGEDQWVRVNSHAWDWCFKSLSLHLCQGTLSSSFSPSERTLNCWLLAYKQLFFYFFVLLSGQKILPEILVTSYLFICCLLWRCRGIVVWPLDSHTESPSSIPAVARYFCPSARVQDTLSTLLLSTQVYRWGPGRMRMVLWLSWHVCACKMATGRNVPQGVEIVHGIKCGTEIESNDRGNNNMCALWYSCTMNSMPKIFFNLSSSFCTDLLLIRLK